LDHAVRIGVGPRQVPVGTAVQVLAAKLSPLALLCALLPLAFLCPQ